MPKVTGTQRIRPGAASPSASKMVAKRLGLAKRCHLVRDFRYVEAGSLDFPQADLKLGNYEVTWSCHRASCSWWPLAGFLREFRSVAGVDTTIALNYPRNEAQPCTVVEKARTKQSIHGDEKWKAKQMKNVFSSGLSRGARNDGSSWRLKMRMEVRETS